MADQSDSGFHGFSLYKRVSLRTQIYLSLWGGGRWEREREWERNISASELSVCSVEFSVDTV